MAKPTKTRSDKLVKDMGPGERFSLPRGAGDPGIGEREWTIQPGARHFEDANTGKIVVACQALRDDGKIIYTAVDVESTVPVWDDV